MKVDHTTWFRVYKSTPDEAREAAGVAPCAEVHRCDNRAWKVRMPDGTPTICNARYPDKCRAELGKDVVLPPNCHSMRKGKSVTYEQLCELRIVHELVVEAGCQCKNGALSRAVELLEGACKLLLEVIEGRS